MTAAPAGDAVLPIDYTIGLNVHDILYRRNASQRELAAVLGITPSVLSKKLRGASWSARQVAMTAEFLGVDPGRLYIQPTQPKVTARLRSIQGEGRDLMPRSPILMPV